MTKTVVKRSYIIKIVTSSLLEADPVTVHDQCRVKFIKHTVH